MKKLLFYIILSTLLLAVLAVNRISSQYSETENSGSSVIEGEIAYEPTAPISSKIAYLTFDDGPSTYITPQILDILKEHDIKATFFVLPRSGVNDIFERIINEEHALGNHSYSHDFSKLYANDGGAFFRNDILRMHEFLRNNFNYETNIFRFPGGTHSWSHSTIAIRKSILEELRYSYFDWDVSSADTDSSPAGRDPNVLSGNILSNTNDRERIIILMHDSNNEAVVAALPIIIEGLKAQRYTFDRL